MRNKKETDSNLVKSYIEGNEFSLEILIKRHQQRLYSFIYSKIQDRDITEDVFQDACITDLRLPHVFNASRKSLFEYGLSEILSSTRTCPETREN